MNISQVDEEVLLLNNESLGMKLSERGIRCTLCNNFTEMVAMLNNQPFSILIIDYDILIKDSKIYLYLMYLLNLRIQVIFIHNSPDFELPIVIKEWGKFHCLNKPVYIQEIIDIITRLRKVILITENRIFAEGLKSILCSNEIICYEATKENFLFIKRKYSINTIIIDSYSFGCLQSFIKEKVNILALLNKSSFNIDTFNLLIQNKLNAILPIDADIEELILTIKNVCEGKKCNNSFFTKTITEFQNDKHYLNEQEYKILLCIAQQMTNTEIAKELFLSPTTINTYISRMTRKLSLNNRAELCVYAWKKFG